MWIILIPVATLGAWCYAQEIKVEAYADNGIAIVVQDQPLRENLETVEKKSAIVFEVSNRVEEERTTARISAGSWP